jgi:hypothetical protein
MLRTFGPSRGHSVPALQSFFPGLLTRHRFDFSSPHVGIEPPHPLRLRSSCLHLASPSRRLSCRPFDPHQPAASPRSPRPLLIAPLIRERGRPAALRPALARRPSIPSVLACPASLRPASWSARFFLPASADGCPAAAQPSSVRPVTWSPRLAPFNRVNRLSRLASLGAGRGRTDSHHSLRHTVILAEHGNPAVNDGDAVGRGSWANLRLRLCLARVLRLWPRLGSLGPVPSAASRRSLPSASGDTRQSSGSSPSAAFHRLLPQSREKISRAAPRRSARRGACGSSPGAIGRASGTCAAGRGSGCRGGGARGCSARG